MARLNLTTGYISIVRPTRRALKHKIIRGLSSTPWKPWSKVPSTKNGGKSSVSVCAVNGGGEGEGSEGGEVASRTLGWGIDASGTVLLRLKDEVTGFR